MDNKKFRMLMAIMIALILAAVVMFGLQNFVLKDRDPETIQIYKASKEIAPYTALTADMFEPVSIPETASLPGMITNLSLATDGLHYASVTIEKGTYLSESVVTQDNFEEGLIYTMEITASFIADVAYNDVVDIYVLGKDNNVTPLFKNKKLYKAKTESLATSAEGATSAYETASKMYIKVTNEEMIRYYTSLRDYKLIVLPYVPEYATSGNTGETVIETPSFTDSNEATMTPTTFSYTVADGDNYEIIADNFGMDVNVLKEVNGNKELTVGETIEIPESN